MQNLPVELVIEILGQMSLKEVIKACSTDKRLQSICKSNDEYIFKKIATRELGKRLTPKEAVMVRAAGLHYPSRHEIMVEAVKKGELGVVRALDGKNEQDKDGNSVLMSIIEDDEISAQTVLKFLELTGININAKNKTRNTALHSAIKKYQSTAEYQLSAEQRQRHRQNNQKLERVIKRLIELGADLNARENDFGLTPLAQALWDEYQIVDRDIIIQMLEKSPNVHIQTHDGETILDLAQGWGWPRRIVQKIQALANQQRGGKRHR
jgi:Ankyrin repeat